MISRCEYMWKLACSIDLHSIPSIARTAGNNVCGVMAAYTPIPTIVARTPTIVINLLSIVGEDHSVIPSFSHMLFYLNKRYGEVQLPCVGMRHVNANAV